LANLYGNENSLFVEIPNYSNKDKLNFEQFSGKEEERQMFQQMQAMAQKQVIIVCLSVCIACY
jgi:hypothetical protein